MPIHFPIRMLEMSRDDYHRLDYEVMGIIFDIHNRLGRLYDEKIYQQAIERGCRNRGIATRSEVPITASYQGNVHGLPGEFTKSYFVDLVAGDGVFYEIKTAESPAPPHRQQLLNYRLLADFRYGKLVNMRTSSVQAEYITASLTKQERFRFNLIQGCWINVNEESAWLRELITALLNEWGAFLDVQLLYDAIAHFRGSPEGLEKPVPVCLGEHVHGTQKIHLLTEDAAIRISAIKSTKQTDRSIAAYEMHLHRFLIHTPLRAIQWINFNRHEILMKTILKSSCVQIVL